ncbi:TonB-dependent siderophore receptor [Variovorax sp. J22P168]|uniref:TonB-dependent siderophore receptor n=1 Tax=Variovorax jilinensis TaxID=3053513 RepID=UPI0025765218|nr:TonB-dependent receptor [Variovorax sp. J22P168]MDM0014729.1 TonB-dependent siderophore receptor [Variovorax sp. J22P168]
MTSTSNIDTGRAPGRRSMTRRLTALTLALCAATGASLAQTPPPAATAALDWSQPAQPLGSALNALALRTGMTVGVDAEAVRGKQATALHGRYTPDQALQQLLQGSGLEASRSSSGGWVLRPAAAAVAPAAAAASVASAGDARQLDEVRVVASRSTATEGTGSFTTDAPMATATGLPLTLRETPQSVSVITRERMDDQGLTEISDVLRQATGLSFIQNGNAGSDANSVYSRGFLVENYQVDGIPQSGSWLTQSGDLAFYDRVEVIRGATGLMNGVGTPAATINLVRKRPTDQFQANATVSAGTWNNYRGEVDIGGPLNEAGNVRGRIVAAVQDSDSWIDRYKQTRRLFYGIVEADVTSSTRVTAGLSIQKLDNDATARSGLPLYFSDGTLSNFSRSQSAAADWAHSYQDQQQFFASVDHTLGAGWKLHAGFNQSRRGYDDVIGYATAGFVDRWTGTGLGLWANRWDSKPVQNSGDLYASGPFELGGRQHELVVGLNGSRTKDEPPIYDGWSNPQIPNFYTWNGAYPFQPENPRTGTQTTITEQSGAYATARLKPTDALAVILGARVSNWSEDVDVRLFDGTTSASSRSENGVVTPYFGLVYDLGSHWSAYTSFTDIFQPQTNRTISGDYLAPLKGKAYEAGVKGAFYEDRLNVSAAVFEIRQDNLAVALPNQFAPDGSQAYRAAQGTTSRGYEFEAAGEVMPGWQIGAGFSRAVARDSEGVRLNTQVPDNMLKLFTAYRIASIGRGLTVGGGLNWQSRTYSTGLGPDYDQTFTQSSYSTLDLMVRYPISRQLSLAVALNNVFDKKYYTSTSSSYYGAPRNVLVTLRASY